MKKEQSFRIKEIHRLSSIGDRNEVYYHTSGILNHEDLMLIIRLHITRQEHSQDLGVIKFFVENTCSGDADPLLYANALAESGYEPIRHGNDVRDWRFKIRLNNVVQLYRNKNNSSIVKRHQDLPTELSVCDKANGLTRIYRLDNENYERKDELLVLGERHNLIGIYSLVRETLEVPKTEVFSRRQFDQMLRKWKDLALWKGNLCIGQWVKINWQPANSRCMVIGYKTSPSDSYPYLVYTRGSRRWDRFVNKQYVAANEIKVCPYFPTNKLIEFAYYCLYNELSTIPDQTQLADIEMKVETDRFANLKANVYADTILLPRLQKAKTDEEAVLAVKTELKKLFLTNGNSQRYGHLDTEYGDIDSPYYPYQLETRMILLQFLADFEVAKPWLGIMMQKPEINPYEQSYWSKFNPDFDEKKTVQIIQDYLENDAHRADSQFCMSSQWFAIYRVMNDLGFVKKSRKLFVQWVNDQGFDYGPACLIDSLDKVPRYFRTRTFMEWKSVDYTSSGKNAGVFTRYYEVADYFYKKLIDML